MITKNEYFITQMKLRELREQRSRLLRTYSELLQRADQEQTEARRLRVLYEELREIMFANQRLHPDVANLEPLLGRADGGAVTPETITFWRERLEKELASGRLRSEIVYIFGALLEEWASSEPETAQAAAQREQVSAPMVERLLQPAPTGDYAALLDTLFAELAFSDRKELVEQMQKAIAAHLPARIAPVELAGVLNQLSGSPYHSPGIRKQAQSFAADHIMQKELADALTIMLEHVAEWQRSQEGVPPRALWTLNKWRLFLDEDLPAVCFLEILGQRWQAVFRQFFSAERAARLKQLRRQHISTQAERAAQMLSAIDRGLRAGSLSEVDIWQQTDGAQRAALPLEEYLGRWEYGSIFEQRQRLKSELHDISQLSSYDALQSASGMEKALMLINAEIMLARTAPTLVPLHLLKIDLKEFYLSLSHELLLEILQRYGLTESQVAFFREFLHVPVRHNGRIVTSERGVPNYHQLSHLLGEVVLGLFEQYIQGRARVQIFRLVDDICLLTTSAEEMSRAWQLVQEFCAACGLVFNAEKCGSACVNGERIPGLPESRPTWLLLILDQKNEWDINWRAFDAYLEGARQQAAQATSLVSRIETYNAHLQYLIKALAMRADLGSVHRQGINTAMERFYHSFFGDGQGIVESVRREIRERFLGETSATRIPEAWLCWPITAGGCGLLQATILAAGYNADFSQRVRVAAPEERASDWQYRKNAWSYLYQALTQEIAASEPVANQIMEALVNDFIRRGSEMADRLQQGLSAYWRWILYLYGPQILDFLGTFRFLITELVPLQLIIQKYRQGALDQTSEA
jgi:hypothetical protein